MIFLTLASFMLFKPNNKSMFHTTLKTTNLTLLHKTLFSTSFLLMYHLTQTQTTPFQSQKLQLSTQLLYKYITTHLTTNTTNKQPHFTLKSSSFLNLHCGCSSLDHNKQPHMAFDLDTPQNDDRVSRIAKTIRVIPNFPKHGVMFQDITTMLLDPSAFKDTIDLFVERYKGKDISVVAGIEARGFIFGPPIALAIGAKFVPMRKPGKLPGKVISEEYTLEYGTDKMEMHVGAVEAGERAIIIDDLIATGGTLSAAIRLLQRVGVEVVESACVIELPELKGRERLGDNPLFVLIKSD